MVNETHKDDPAASGTIGGIGPHVKLRLRDIPEMNYLSTDSPYPRGEMQYFGNTIFSGYFKNPAKT